MARCVRSQQNGHFEIEYTSREVIECHQTEEEWAAPGGVHQRDLFVVLLPLFEEVSSRQPVSLPPPQ
jgi:hypothetical protein